MNHEPKRWVDTGSLGDWALFLIGALLLILVVESCGPDHPSAAPNYDYRAERT